MGGSGASYQGDSQLSRDASGQVLAMVAARSETPNSSTGPVVSVIVPAYNRVAYIDRTVQSVLDQTYRSFKLIVVDDGSTDGTLEVLSQYASKNQLTLLTHPNQENRGQSAAINLGLEHATGEYVCILDSDDMFRPNKLEVQVAYLEHHPEVGLVYSNGHAVDANDRILYPMHSSNHHEQNDPNRLLMNCYLLLPLDSMVRRSVMVRAGRFEESFRSAQDHDMALRIAEITRLAYIPDHLFFYRRHDESISARNQNVRWRTGFEILRRARRRYPYQRSAVRKRRAVLHFRMGQVFWRAGRRLVAAGHFALAGLLDPVRSLAVLRGREKVR